MTRLPLTRELATYLQTSCKIFGLTYKRVLGQKQPVTDITIQIAANAADLVLRIESELHDQTGDTIDLQVSDLDITALYQVNLFAQMIEPGAKDTLHKMLVIMRASITTKPPSPLPTEMTETDKQAFRDIK